ncbi:uncharacterized protein F4822DRAFT_440391 [Hypoxylon trugodes]|uniref:uncharacterized protein n=1 Tax=Hypoxylon trugodes TaxID=326681 RepID=UPI0021997EEC|nr:uncharacterized protein F4822DRAFT_440391 [Hypoxylon trugodes]KAI1384283.1 hypothetical protein F4822DRAFT_440391 [Hypoxylon trugodes]
MSSNTPQEHSPESRTSWSEIEDHILKQGVARHGVNHWDDVAQMIWTRRSTEECRARWAQLLPILHDDLARQESDLERQRQQHRNRSLTTPELNRSKSIEMNESVRVELPLLPLSPATQVEPTEIVAEEASHRNGTRVIPRPRSPLPTSSAPIPIPAPRPPLRRGTVEDDLQYHHRLRSFTEPGLRPRPPSSIRPRLEQEPQQPRELLAPHPLMPGRHRKSSSSSREAVGSGLNSRRGSRDMPSPLQRVRNSLYDSDTRSIDYTAFFYLDSQQDTLKKETDRLRHEKTQDQRAEVRTKADCIW